VFYLSVDLIRRIQLKRIPFFVPHFFLFLTALCCLNVKPAEADPYHPQFYLSEERGHSKIRTFSPPEERPRGIHPRLLSEVSEIQIEVGETVLIPIFARTGYDLPVPIRWTLENNIAAFASSTIDPARPTSLNGYTLSTHGWRGLMPSGIAFGNASSVVTSKLGCERRFQPDNGDVFLDGLRTKRPFRSEIFLCLHGVAPGKGQIYFGEQNSAIEFSKQERGMILIDANSFMNETVRKAITVEVVEPRNQTLRQELSMAEVTVSSCTLASCEFKAIALNRGGERLKCGTDSISVNWHWASTAFTFVRQDKCNLTLKPRFLPRSDETIFPLRFLVRASVKQVEKRQTKRFGKTITVKVGKEAEAAVFTHPLNVTETNKLKWPAALCPLVVSPGASFSCLITVFSDTGNPPDPFDISDQDWRLPSGIEFAGFTTSSKYYACFRVASNVEDGVVKGIEGRFTNGQIFSGAKMIVSTDFSNYLSKAKPSDCP
jgi:hypothetical protein